MAVYVDDAVWPWRGELWCHLVADTPEELEAFARELGLRRRWLQHKPTRPWLDHYDLPSYGRDQAVRRGAVPVTRAEIVTLIRGKRAAARGVAGPPV